MPNYISSGAGNAAYNGTFVDTGVYGSKRYYLNENGIYMWFSAGVPISGGWEMGSSLGGGPNMAHYFVAGNTATPPLSGWAKYPPGTNPPPTLAESGGGAADTTRPAYASSSVDSTGSYVDVVLIEAGSPPILPGTGITGFSVLVNGVARSVSSAVRKGSSSPDNVTVRLTLASAVLQGDTVTVSYNPGNVTDSASTPNAMNAYGAQGVTNNSTTRPAAPTGLSAIAASDTQIDLSWTASTTGNVTYNIYRGGVLTGNTAGTAYNDAGRSANSSFTYTVKAVRNGVESAASNPATSKTLPSAPTGLTATAQSGAYVIDLSWAAPAGGANSYNVYRDGVLVTNQPGTTYNDTGRSSNTNFTYTIKAVNSSGESVASGSANATTAPAAPSLNAAPGYHTVVLSWNAPSGAASYRLERAPHNGTFSALITQTGTTYDDSTVTNGVEYDYRVIAINAGDKASVASNVVTVTSADDVKPTFASASVNAAGDTLTVQLAETQSQPILPASSITGFTLNGVSGRSIGNGTRSGNTSITFPISGGVVYQSETPTVSYAPGNVTDSASPANAMVAFANQGVSNGSTQRPPAPSVQISNCNTATVNAYGVLPSGFTSATLEHFAPSTQAWNEATGLSLPNLEPGLHRFRWRLNAPSGNVDGNETAKTISQPLSVTITSDQHGNTAPPVTVDAMVSWTGGGSNGQVEWNEGKGAGFVSGTSTRQIAYDTPGSYQLTVRVTDENGCIGEDSATVTVTQAVGIEKLQYRLEGEGAWQDIDNLSVPQGSSIEFKAIKTPPEANWPAGKPVWSGAANGTGETITADFLEAGTFTISAESGNIVTANVTVTAVVTGGHWFHKQWENTSQVEWSHSGDPADPSKVSWKLAPSANAVECCGWQPDEGGDPRPDDLRPVPYQVVSADVEQVDGHPAHVVRLQAISTCDGPPHELEAKYRLDAESGDEFCEVTYGDCPAPVIIDENNLDVRPTIALGGYASPVGPSPSIGMFFNSLGGGLPGIWRHSYDANLNVAVNNDVTLSTPDGKQRTYRAVGGGYASEAGDTTKLVKTGDGRYELVAPDGSKQLYQTGPGNASPVLAEERDALGNALRIERDSEGRVISVTDALGRQTNFSYDGNGRLHQVTDPYGQSSTLSYDAEGRLMQASTGTCRNIVYAYDASGRVSGMTQGEETWSFEREELPDYQTRLTVTDPAGNKQEYLRDAVNGRTFHVGARDYAPGAAGDPAAPRRVSSMGQDANGRAQLVRRQEAGAGATTFERDPVSGLPTKITDALGRSTRYEYNAAGNVTKVTDALNQSTTMEYAANSVDVLRVKDALNNVVASFTYNDRHQVVTATDAAGATVTTTYTSWGAVASETDAIGTTVYTYDDESKLLQSVARDGNVLVAYTYDSRDRVRTQTDAAGLVLTYDYDESGQVTKVTYPDGSFEQTSYCACHCSSAGQPSRVVDRAGRATAFEYDTLGRLTKVTDPAGYSVEYSYDAEGNRTGLIDTKGTATVFAYDAAGRLTKKTYADTSYEQYTYDAAGQLISQRDAKGNVVSFEYDLAGRMTKIDYPNDPDVTMTYDALGRLASKTDAVGTTTYSYDAADRIISIDGPWENDTITYSYDALGRRTAVGINGQAQAEYSYDELDRLAKVTSGSQIFGYDYQGASDQLLKLVLPGGARTEYSYDALQRLSKVQSLKANSANVSKFEYGYDKRDVRTFVEKTLGASAQRVNFGYDAIDQLTKESSPEATPALNKEYSYDAMGNRAAVVDEGASNLYTFNALNQITQLVSGGVTTTLAYDANGNLIAKGDSLFEYDEFDRLVKVTIPNEKKSEFVYDSEGRKRLSRKFDWVSGAWYQSDERRFVYDGMDLVQERGVGGSVRASYVRDGNIGGVLSMTNDDGTFFYHYDGSGNVVALTDELQNVVAQYTYDAFGNLLSSSGSQAEMNPFRFSTKYFDADTGLYDYGYRHYDPQLGRWINRDPIGEEGGLNLYGFVANDPGNSWDEYGEARGARPAYGRRVRSRARDTVNNNGRRRPNSPQRPGGARFDDPTIPNYGVPCPPGGMPPSGMVSPRSRPGRPAPDPGVWNKAGTVYKVGRAGANQAGAKATFHWLHGKMGGGPLRIIRDTRKGNNRIVGVRNTSGTLFYRPKFGKNGQIANIVVKRGGKEYNIHYYY